MDIVLQPIGFVVSQRQAIQDDDWGQVVSDIELVAAMPSEALEGIETFSHVEIIFFFDQVPPEKIQSGARHPRNNLDWPRVGILAQRGKNRPNRLGLTIAKVLARKDKTLTVEGLDAIDGTPVLDIKPVMEEFLPRESIQQPHWSRQLMEFYW